MHRRATVRGAIVTAITGLASTGSRVTVGRVYPDTVTGLPSLSVVTGSETVDDEEAIMVPATAAMWPQSRVCEFEIEIRAADDDEADQVSLEVETALNADETLGGEVNRIEYAGSPEPERSGEVESPIMIRILAYEAIYRVNARDPQALED